jgi:hypothetical protein
MSLVEHYQICRAEILADLEAERQAEFAEQHAELLAELQAETETNYERLQAFGHRSNNALLAGVGFRL